MANKIIIPVEAKLNLDSLNKLKQGILTITNDTNNKFTASQKASAQSLLKTITDLSSRLGKGILNEDITKQQFKIYQEGFNFVAEESQSLGHKIKKYLTSQGDKILSEEDLNKLNTADDEVTSLSKKLENLQQNPIEPVKFTSISSEDERKELKMSTTTVLKTAKERLQSYTEEEAKLEALKLKNKTLSDQEANRLAWLKNTQTLRSDMSNKVNAQFDKEIKYNNDLKLTEEELKKAQLSKGILLKQLMANATEDQRKVLNLLIDESKVLEENTKKISLQDKLKSLGKDLNIFSGFTKGLQNNFTSFVGSIASGALVISTLKNIFRDTISTIRDLDKAFNEIAMVTTYTTEEVWQMKDAFIGIATTTGLSVVEVTKLAGEFFRQGRSLSETLKLTEAAGTAAKVAGISAGDSVNYLTSAINGYKLSADQAMAVSDKFAALAAASATDYEELAIALSKVAAQAYTAGVNMDNMMGFIAKALEVTREAPENIGTAFKTIFARMSELKDYGKTLEDGMDVNRVDKALASIGVALTDQSNELRNLDDVLIDVGNKWNSLNKNQKAYITTALAGTRQQTRLLAVFEDFDRTMELADVSANSLGATFAQQEKYYSSIAYAQNKLTVAWQDFISSLGSSELFILFYNTLAGATGILNQLMSTFKSFGPILVVLTTGLTLLGVASAAHNKTLLEKIMLQGIANGLDAKAAIIKAAETVAEWARVASVNAYIKAQYEALTASLASGNIVAWLSVIVLGLTAAFTALSFALGNSERKNKKFAEEMKKSQAAMFNFRKEADQLEGFLDKYLEIDKQVIKTSEDLNEQNQLIQQMQDLLGEDTQVTDLTGKFNINVVRDEIKKLRQEADDEFAKSLATAKSTYSSIEEAYKNQTDTIIRQQLLIQKAIDSGAVDSYSSFLELDSKKREQILATAQLEIEAAQYVTTQKERMAEDYNGNMVGTGVFDTVVDADKLEEAKGYLADLFNQDFSNSSLSQQIQMLNDLNFETWDEGITESISNTMPQIDALTKLMERLNVTTLEALGNVVSQSSLTESQIITLNDAIANTNLTLTQQDELFDRLVKSGPDFFGTLTQYAADANLSIFDTLDIAQQLKDTLSNVSIQGLNDQLVSIRSINENIDKINSMMTGETAYDLSYLNEMATLYPEIGSAIAANAQISESTREQIVADEKEKFATNIDLQIADLEANIELNNLRIKEYEKMLNSEAEFNKWAKENSIDLETATITEIGNAWSKYRQDQIRDEISTKRKLLEINKEFLTPEDYQRQLDSLNASEAGLETTLQNLFPIQEETNASTGSFSEKIHTAIAALEDSNTSIRAQISVLQNLKNNIDKVTAATQAGTDAAEDYKAALDKIALLSTQIEAMGEQLSLYETMEENAKTGEDWLTAIYSQNAALQTQNTLLTDNIQAQKDQQQAILDSLGNLRQYTRVVNGRLIVASMQDYLNLSDEQQKIIDDSVESYNNLSSSINDNTQQLQDNTNAIEENLQKIEDKTVELYDTVAEAIKNAEETRLNELNDAWDAEKELLDKRKAAYEEAFSEQDYNESLQDIAAEREDIIKKLSALEGASDLNSLKKKQELLDKKKELDSQYNDKVTEYNRGALLESIDDQSAAIDETQSSYQDAYEKRINDTAWMEEQVKNIINQGLDATLAYLQQNLPEYTEAWSIEKDNITDGWTLLYDQVTKTVESIEQNIPDFSGMLEQLREAYDYVGGLSNTTPDAPYVNPDYNEPKTKTVWVYNGKQYDTKEAADAAKAKAVSDAQKALDSLITKRRTWVAAGRGFTAQDLANLDTQIKSAQQNLNGYGSMSISSKIVSAKKGGLVDYTGLAMLHGSPSKPERVLSDNQTQMFDQLVQNLETLKNNNSSSATNSSIAIDNITIQTPQLNTNTDFKNAGRDLAEEILTAISERGLAINKKR